MINQENFCLSKELACFKLMKENNFGVLKRGWPTFAITKNEKVIAVVKCKTRRIWFHPVERIMYRALVQTGIPVYVWTDIIGIRVLAFPGLNILRSPEIEASQILKYKRPFKMKDRKPGYSKARFEQEQRYVEFAWIRPVERKKKFVIKKKDS